MGVPRGMLTKLCSKESCKIGQGSLQELESDLQGRKGGRKGPRGSDGLLIAHAVSSRPRCAAELGSDTSRSRISACRGLSRVPPGRSSAGDLESKGKPSSQRRSSGSGGKSGRWQPQGSLVNCHLCWRQRRGRFSWRPYSLLSL